MLAKLTALVPRPRVNLTRYHGVFAPKQQATATTRALQDANTQLFNKLKTKEKPHSTPYTHDRTGLNSNEIRSTRILSSDRQSRRTYRAQLDSSNRTQNDATRAAAKRQHHRHWQRTGGAGTGLIYRRT